MENERRCGVWARGSGCVEVKGHEGPHVSQCQALLAERDAEIARLREALAGMLESYELCMGDELAFSDLTKDTMRGAFINEPARARAALAARGGAS